MLSPFRLNVSRLRKSFLAFAFLTVLILLFNLPVWSAAGDLDASFGQNGISAAPGLDASASSTSMALQPDGKIIVGGIVRSPPGFYSFTLVRYLPAGSVDTSFGNNGIVITSSPVSNSSGSNLNDVAVLPDGKIVAVGWILVPDPITGFSRRNLIVFRYNANGSLDTTFHDNGKYMYSLGGFSASGEAVKVQPDGKFVVTGYTGGAIKGEVPNKSLLFRFAGDTLDPAFQNGQTQVVPGYTEGYSVALQADGKIIVGGRTSTTGANGLSLTRYNADGTIDTSFGNNGRIIRGNENLSEAIEVLVQPDGKIVAVSSIFPNGNFRDLAILRFNSDGSPDSSFGTGGKVITAISNLSDTPSGGVLQANGKIVVSGFSHNYNGGNSDVFPILVRYNSDGSLDRAFGIGGIARTPSGATHGDIILQRDGKILTATSVRPNNVYSSFRTARYQANGTRDFDFDGDRKADVSIFRPSAAAEWYWLNSSNNESSGWQFGNGTDKPVPADYDGDGKTDLAVYRPADGVWYLQRSHLGFTAAQFGISTDQPVPADYDGDGKSDLAVFRDGTWYLQQSTAGFRAIQFGAANDQPVPSAFLP